MTPVTPAQCYAWWVSGIAVGLIVATVLAYFGGGPEIVGGFAIATTVIALGLQRRAGVK